MQYHSSSLLVQGVIGHMAEIVAATGSIGKKLENWWRTVEGSQWGRGSLVQEAESMMFATIGRSKLTSWSSLTGVLLLQFCDLVS